MAERSNEFDTVQEDLVRKMPCALPSERALLGSILIDPACITEVLTVLGAAVFLISASPGYLDIYYKEVSLSTIRGATVLEKVYGPWHSVYLFYLLGYFGVTAAAIAYASVSKKIDSPTHAILLAAVLFINMAGIRYIKVRTPEGSI